MNAGVTTRPRVLFVTARARPELGGIESHVAEIAGRAVERGYDVEVLTTDRSGRLPRREQVAGYTVRRFRALPASRDWYASPGLFWAVLTSRADVVHVQGVHTLVPPAALLAALLRRRKTVLTFHTGGSSSALRRRSRGLQWRLLTPLLRRTTRLVGVSHFEADLFSEVTGRDDVMVIRNGGALPLHSTVESDPDLMLSIGRLERYKGHHRAVAALPELLRTRPRARLEILGSGPAEQELRSLADRLGVGERVRLRSLPPEDRAAMGAAVSRAGVVVLLSDYEAHPVAVMEALTVGRPVVVSRTSGLTELADLGWARGLPASATAAETAAVIEQQLTSPVLPDAAELPTWETCMDGLDDLYRDVLGRPLRSATTQRSTTTQSSATTQRSPAATAGSR